MLTTEWVTYVRLHGRLYPVLTCNYKSVFSLTFPLPRKFWVYLQNLRLGQDWTFVVTHSKISPTNHHLKQDFSYLARVWQLQWIRAQDSGWQRTIHAATCANPVLRKMSLFSSFPVFQSKSCNFVCVHLEICPWNHWPFTRHFRVWANTFNDMYASVLAAFFLPCTAAWCHTVHIVELVVDGWPRGFETHHFCANSDRNTLLKCVWFTSKPVAAWGVMILSCTNRGQQSGSCTAQHTHGRAHFAPRIWAFVRQ